MEELIPLLAIFFVIGVPVMSIAARFALRPLLKDFAQALGRGEPNGGEDLSERLAVLEARLVDQGHQLDQLVDAELFRRELETRADKMSQLGAGAGMSPTVRPGASAPGH